MCLNPLINGCKLIMKLFCGQGGAGGKGEIMLHDFSVAIVYWLERIFEIRNHILENAFSLYTILSS